VSGVWILRDHVLVVISQLTKLNPKQLINDNLLLIPKYVELYQFPNRSLHPATRAIGDIVMER
jgi:hypothetical protein